MVLNPEGRAVWNSSTSKWEYEYDVKDHLGNTRASFAINDKVKVLQTRDYYPFGLEQANWYVNDANASKFRYNGKELQDENGLGWYDYGARFYDPQLGRWHVIDNKAEKYYRTSPYTYALNNPIRFIDPDGNVVVDATGNPISYSAKSGWSSNVTTDVRRIGTAMMATPKGTEMFNRMMNANHKITITIDSGKGNGTEMATTSSSKSGNNIGKADVIIYEGMAQERLDKLKTTKMALDEGGRFASPPSDKMQAFIENMPMNVDEIMAATAAHEAEHATNKDANANFEPSYQNRETIADQTQIEVIKQTPRYRLEKLEPKRAVVTTSN